MQGLSLNVVNLKVWSGKRRFMAVYMEEVSDKWIKDTSNFHIFVLKRIIFILVIEK